MATDTLVGFHDVRHGLVKASCESGPSGQPANFGCARLPVSISTEKRNFSSVFWARISQSSAKNPSILQGRAHHHGVAVRRAPLETGGAATVKNDLEIGGCSKWRAELRVEHPAAICDLIVRPLKLPPPAVLGACRAKNGTPSTRPLRVEELGPCAGLQRESSGSSWNSCIPCRGRPLVECRTSS
jgi:hypothetical protein